MSNLITESYSQLTDGEKIVFNILKRTNEILALNLKERSDDEKRQLQGYYYQLTKMDKNIIQEVLKKCPDLKKKAKTVAQRKSASRSAQNEEKKEVETEKRKQGMRQSRRGQFEEKKEVEREKAKQGMTEIRSMEDP